MNYLPVFGEVGRVCGRVGPGFSWPLRINCGIYLTYKRMFV
ncbi:MAG: hypothetical protein E6I58_16120 [Chloroflexi bacterium]|nr:MAG: hypothetical protein E6I58_16120 [Chloroflexota bacterium]